MRVASPGSVSIHLKITSVKLQRHSQGGISLDTKAHIYSIYSDTHGNAVIFTFSLITELTEKLGIFVLYLKAFWYLLYGAS